MRHSDPACDERAERLAGGNVGGAVRVGQTVRRSAGGWTPTVPALLTHLRARGIVEVPRPLGVDDRGREILGYVEGVVPSSEPLPDWAGTDELLIAEAARRLRLFCDAYGLRGRSGLVDVIARRQQALHDTIQAFAAQGHPAFVAMQGSERSSQPLRDRSHLLAHREALERTLS